jgi:tripartite-type tricarboxylate transporter receptor subunit TctC
MKQLLLLLLLVPALASAWEPTRPITVSVGNAPGAGNEIAFRKLAEIAQKSNPNLTFIVENRPGADSVVNMNLLMTQPNNGYYAAIPSHMGTYVTNDIWEAKIKKFNHDSFTDVISIGKSPLVLVAHASSKINTPRDFEQLVQKTNKPVNVAIGGGAHRMAFEYFMAKTKGNADQVKTIKFQGPLQAVTSVAGYDGKSGTEFGIMPITIAKPLIDGGKIKPIGFTGNRTIASYPDVPLLATITPGIDVYAGWAIALPPNTPPDVVDWYVKTFGNAINTTEYRAWMYTNLVFVDESELTPPGFRRFITRLRGNFMPIAKTLKLDE